jgi:hypothetical protein
MKLSDQAMGTLMMVLQKCLMEQSDIIPMLKDLNFVVTKRDESDSTHDELSVENPPTLHFDHNTTANDATEENA